MPVHRDGGTIALNALPRCERRWPEVAGPRILTSLNVNRWEDIRSTSRPETQKVGIMPKPKLSVCIHSIGLVSGYDAKQIAVARPACYLRC